MKGNKFLAAVLAASMAFSMVPVTAMSAFADSVSVEASDVQGGAAATTQTHSYTINGKDKSDYDADSNIYKVAYALNTSTTNIAAGATEDSDSAVITALQNIVNNVVDEVDVDPDTHPAKTNIDKDGNKWTVISTTLVSGKGNGDVVIEVSNGDTYTITFSTSAAITGTEADALDDLFNAITAVTYDGKTINSQVVQKAFDAALAKAKNGADTSIDIDYFESAPGSSKSYTVKDATVSGDTVTGHLANDSGDIYSYTAKAVQNSDSARDVITDAVAEVQKNEYPSVDGSTDSNYASVVAKIEKDIDDALDGKATADFSDVVVDPATHKYSGTLSAKVNGKLYTFTLKHSSAQKDDEAVKAITKTALKGSTANTDKTALAIYKGKDTTTNLNEGATSPSTVTNTYVFLSTSAFSRAIQDRKATVAVDAETVRAAVEKAVTDATADYADDGVTYTVESFDGKIDLNGGIDDLIDAQTKATSEKEGTYVVKVKTSIANDMYGIKAGADKNLENTYYVVVKTPALKAVNPTAISLADKTVVLNKDVADSEPVAGTTFTATKDLVEITPVLTPSDANTTLNWTLKDKDGNEVSTAGVVSGTVYDKDSNSITLGNGKFAFAKAGVYTVEVSSANDPTVKASMKLTILDNFKDVSNTSYYADAVKWAYGNGTTDGISEDSFGVNNSVTRAQYVTWLYRYAVSKDSSVAIDDDDVTSAFSDVAADKYYAKAVQWAVANGVTDGTSTTTFSPDQKISRAQAITMLWRMNGKPYAGHGSQDESVVKFTDVPSNAYYTTAVTWAVQTYRDITATTTAESVPITSGTSTTTFSPDADCTRAQAITFIYRAYA